MKVSEIERVDETGDAERYRLVSLESASAPEGCAGRDWFVYRILQGVNAITGYRQGSRAQVAAEVEVILSGLNGRRRWSSNKPLSRSGRGAGRGKGAAQSPAAEAPAADLAEEAE